MKSDSVQSHPFVLDLKATADLRAKLKADPEANLKQAAQQFEGMLLQMMLKSMRDATPQDGVMDSDQTRFFTSIMDQQLAQNLAAQGKFGFARQIEQQLGRAAGTPPANAATEPTAAALEVLRQVTLARQAASSAAAGTAPANAAERAAATGVNALPLGANDFVNRIWPHAVDAAKSVGVPPQFVVAHSALESGWGKSEIRAANGAPSYNLFGVKAGRSWNGPAVEVTTTEYVDGVAQTAREKFRVYGSYAEAFADYAALLRNNPRFAAVVGQQGGADFARSLQQAGYATDPQYADKLTRIINGSTLRQALVG